jgi:hypothetical protein
MAEASACIPFEASYPKVGYVHGMVIWRAVLWAGNLYPVIRPTSCMMTGSYMVCLGDRQVTVNAVHCFMMKDNEKQRQCTAGSLVLPRQKELLKGSLHT